jgi:succinylglutamate desuccinylase
VTPRDSASVSAAELASAPPRVVARLRGAESGPTLIVIAGLHGNEPAGLTAATRMLESLSRAGNLSRGELVVLAGNRRALARGVRFVQRDLNRQWSVERLNELRNAAASPAVVLGPEDREQLELAEALDQALAAARGRVYVVDLHTTSAEGIPFVLIGDHLRHRSFALGFPLPLLLGMFGKLGGTLTEYLSARRCVTLAIEGGQHASDRAVSHHEAVLSVALVASGLVPESSLAGLGEHRARLAATWPDLPRALRVHHRHAITAADRFVMEPGFANVQRVNAGTLLAHDARGEIRTGHDEVLIMPLYQKMGDDGYFLGREIPAALFQLGAWVGSLWRS